MSALSENHKRALMSRLHRIDNLLRELEACIPAAGFEALFQEEIADWTCEKRRIVSDWIAEVRGLLKSIIESKGLAVAAPVASSAWLVRSSVDAMLSVVDELRAERMRGYGELSAEAGQELDEIVAALQQLFLKLPAALG